MFFTWLGKMAINKQLVLLKHTPINLPIASYILVYFLATGLGIMDGKVNAPQSFFYVLKYIEYFMLYFMVTNIIENKKQVKTFIIAILLTCIVTCAYANVTLGKFGRATAPFEGAGEPNTLGGYLVFLFAIVSGLFLYNTSPILQVCLGALASFIFLTLLHTLSRGSYLAFIPMYLTLIILSKRKKGLLIMLLILAILLLPVLLPKKVITRITNTFIPGRVYEPFGERIVLDESAAARIGGMQRVLEMWSDRPFFGYGATGVGFTDFHYALVLGETGVIGFLIFNWLLIIIFRYGLQTFRKINEDWAKGLTLGFLAGFIGLLFHSFSANTFIIIRIMEPFWFLVAVIMTLSQIPLEEIQT
jgi:O-antigen ligase